MWSIWNAFGGTFRTNLNPILAVHGADEFMSPQGLLYMSFLTVSCESGSCLGAGISVFRLQEKFNFQKQVFALW